MPGRVADASVLGALVFGEPRGEEAISLLQQQELYEPTLLGYELASIARKKIVLHVEQRDALLAALQEALSLDIHWVETDHTEVVRLALETRLTTYDASYLYVAQSLGLALVTFDARLQAVVDAKR